MFSFSNLRLGVRLGGAFAIVVLGLVLVAAAG